MTVSDDGPGVTEEDRSRIFEPYFTRKPNGIGLGLYIARLVIEPHGRLVYKEVGVLGGATFEAEFDQVSDYATGTKAGSVQSVGVAAAATRCRTPFAPSAR